MAHHCPSVTAVPSSIHAVYGPSLSRCDCGGIQYACSLWPITVPVWLWCRPVCMQSMAHHCPSVTGAVQYACSLWPITVPVWLWWYPVCMQSMAHHCPGVTVVVSSIHAFYGPSLSQCDCGGIQYACSLWPITVPVWLRWYPVCMQSMAHHCPGVTVVVSSMHAVYGPSLFRCDCGAVQYACSLWPITVPVWLWWYPVCMQSVAHHCPGVTAVVSSMHAVYGPSLSQCDCGGIQYACSLWPITVPVWLWCRPVCMQSMAHHCPGVTVVVSSMHAVYGPSLSQCDCGAVQYACSLWPITVPVWLWWYPVCMQSMAHHCPGMQSMAHCCPGVTVTVWSSSMHAVYGPVWLSVCMQSMAHHCPSVTAVVSSMHAVYGPSLSRCDCGGIQYACSLWPITLPVWLWCRPLCMQSMAHHCPGVTVVVSIMHAVYGPSLSRCDCGGIQYACSLWPITVPVWLWWYPVCMQSMPHGLQGQ